MFGRVAFLAFGLGLLLGLWLGDVLQPRKQLPVRVNCSPAAEQV